jgi:hypothetical protein
MIQNTYQIFCSEIHNINNPLVILFESSEDLCNLNLYYITLPGFFPFNLGILHCIL